MMPHHHTSTINYGELNEDTIIDIDSDIADDEARPPILMTILTAFKYGMPLFLPTTVVSLKRLGTAEIS